MANQIQTINGVNFCNNAQIVNSVTQSHILNVDSILQNCEGEGCYTCGPLKFSFSSKADGGDCAAACVGGCDTYYSKDYGTAFNGKPTGCTECSLQLGTPIYTNTECSTAPDGFYSPKNCSVDCDRCYTLLGGIIVAINTCVETCNPCEKGVPLAFAETCDAACNEESCPIYFSDGNCAICPLLVGDTLWTDEICTKAQKGFYSTNKCKNLEDCLVCYEVDNLGKIIAVTNCGEPVETCRPINMTIIPHETCDDACRDMSCITRFTSRPAGEQMQSGDFIYDNPECDCFPDSQWTMEQGFWQTWFSGCAQSPIQPNYNQCVYLAQGTCRVSSVNSCVDHPGGPIDSE